MKTGMLLLCLCLFSAVRASSLDEIRQNFTLAVTDKNICRQMMEALQAKAKDPLCLCYLGGFQAIWATHVFNPFSKLKTFREGKRNIENAIGKDTSNAELRYIRFSIQRNAPSFLGYRQYMEKDREFLRLHQQEIASFVVIRNIGKLLKK